MSDKQCMFPHCDGAFYARGLCKPHYMLAFKLVRYREVTWEELVEHKKCLSKQKEIMSDAEEWFLSTNNNHQ